MAKRKAPAPKKIWARIVNGGWELYLPSGETLRPTRQLEPSEALALAGAMRAFEISYLRPVKELGDDRASILQSLNTSDEGGPNTLWVFRPASGPESLVIEKHH